MIWSGSLALLVALGPPLPDGLAARVARAIAREWRVEPEVVRIQWGIMPIRATVADDAPFRLVGGRDGRYVALVGSARGELAVSLRAGIEDSTWVTSRAVGSGVSLTAADVTRALRTTWGSVAAGPDDAPPIGWETQRSLRAGEVLVPPAIREPIEVEPGMVVRFEWRQGPIAIVREAIAGNRARNGETIWAKDRVSGQRLSGVVTGRARARLILGGTR